MVNTKVYFRIFLAMLVALCTGTIMLLYTPVLNTTYHFMKSATRNGSNELIKDIGKSITASSTHKTNTKPLHINSPFIDPKLHIFNDYLTILWWNAPPWIKAKQNNTDMKECNYKNCKVSFDRKDFNKSSAVVFTIGHRGMSSIPPVSMSKRNPDQAWIFHTMESPVHVKKSSSAFLSPNYHNAFNWSWNYRTDSDIFSPYGWLNTKAILPVRNYAEVFRNKTKQVAWLVSHCHSVGGRDNYVRALNEYIPVDIYGKCGKKAPENILELINKNYKFYLGFENSLCVDYVTEKFFRYYQLDVITILRGKTKYSDYFPAHSYVDTADFSSIEALGKFLKTLSENEEEFIKYMKIKDMYDVQKEIIVYRDSVCNVCDKLNNPDKNRNIYKNLYEWTETCEKPNDLN